MDSVYSTFKWAIEQRRENLTCFDEDCSIYLKWRASKASWVKLVSSDSCEQWFHLQCIGRNLSSWTQSAGGSCLLDLICSKHNPQWYLYKVWLPKSQFSSFEWLLLNSFRLIQCIQLLLLQNLQLYIIIFFYLTQSSPQHDGRSNSDTLQAQSYTKRSGQALLYWLYMHVSTSARACPPLNKDFAYSMLWDWLWCNLKE